MTLVSRPEDKHLQILGTFLYQFQVGATLYRVVGRIDAGNAICAQMGSLQLSVDHACSISFNHRAHCTMLPFNTPAKVESRRIPYFTVSEVGSARTMQFVSQPQVHTSSATHTFPS